MNPAVGEHAALLTWAQECETGGNAKGGCKVELLPEVRRRVPQESSLLGSGTLGSPVSLVTGTALCRGEAAEHRTQAGRHSPHT